MSDILLATWNIPPLPFLFPSPIAVRGSVKALKLSQWVQLPNVVICTFFAEDTRAKPCVMFGSIYTCFAFYCISAVLRDRCWF